ncbi:ThiF family adenylyltransferase [Jatrophihabitans cynanchi]|uniref:ThiF family adenylyltransferase n=1 Tax=Jatrophihabitans cynanchi TaxID=2944128 RepID=A0ABY7K4G5_9ACTN|nr:ThiF family adenylyltransferase [Jatrophihabitans sp. SB3-54]WAX58522.1 ThiF family adenylyltransferase [Jatrophihabitans sp. SB3-54]
MTTTLVVPDRLASRLRELSTYDVETGGVILARLVRTPEDNIRLLARELLEVPDHAYERREAQQLLISSEGYVPALARAEEAGCVPIWFHTHPGNDSNPAPSRHDLTVNRSLSDLFRLRADSPFYGALITSSDDGTITFTGSLDDGVSIAPIDRLWVVGPRLALYHACDSEHQGVLDIYDRNIRAFGGPVQRVLGDLRAGIVGCGGTGSAVAEQLVRLGVRDIQLIDPDELSDSNVTRVYGSRLKDVGRPKVEVLADHLADILPSIRVRPIQSMITVEETARLLLDADIVFGCTDDNAGRMVLSRLSTYLLVPVIDCGVLLSSDGAGRLDGIHGRVTVLHPGQACLICRGRVDLGRARSEMLTPEERNRLVDEGYAPALPGVEPAVVAYTSAVAAAAVAELIERLTHHGVDPVPSEVLLRLHDREVSTNNQEPLDRHYCHDSSGKIGLGLTAPFLDQTW